MAVETQDTKLNLALTEKLLNLNENVGTGRKDPAIKGGLGYSKYWYANILPVISIVKYLYAMTGVTGWIYLDEKDK
ncbi:3691_t:CDS:2, partial [Paraglomus brasilianum]